MNTDLLTRQYHQNWKRDLIRFGIRPGYLAKVDLYVLKDVCKFPPFVEGGQKKISSFFGQPCDHISQVSARAIIRFFSQKSPEHARNHVRRRWQPAQLYFLVHYCCKPKLSGVPSRVSCGVMWRYVGNILHKYTFTDVCLCACVCVYAFACLCIHIHTPTHSNQGWCRMNVCVYTFKWMPAYAYIRIKNTDIQLIIVWCMCIPGENGGKGWCNPRPGPNLNFFWRKSGWTDSTFFFLKEWNPDQNSRKILPTQFQFQPAHSFFFFNNRVEPAQAEFV